MAAGAYGPDWEHRGRSHLGEAAVLLAALWPSGAAPAAQGAAVHRISLLRHLRPRHIGPLKGAIAAGAAVAVVAVVVVAQTRSAPLAPFPTISGGLFRVAAVSDNSAWAVGCTDCGTGSGTFSTGTGRTLMMRWNGTAWTRVPSPDPGTSRTILGLAAASGGSAWAVGWTGNGSSTSPTSTRTLILRWNGSAWTQVPSPNPGPDSELVGVTATSADSAWAVGWTQGNTLILRWNGTTWTQVPSRNPGLDGSLCQA